MPVQHPPRPLPTLARMLTAGSVVLAVAGCSGHILPLGPGPTPVAMTPPRHLGSPIIVQVMRLQPATAAGRCRAGWVAVTLPAGGGPRTSIAAVPAGPKGASAPPSSPAPPPAASANCYRPVGAPVTITSAAISSVFTYRPPGQAKGPGLYGFIIGVPAAYVATVTAVIRHAHDTGSAVGISVDGKLWQAPLVWRPFPGQRLEISLLSRNQALQLHHILVPAG